MEPLIVALNDTTSSVQWRASEALEKIKEPAVMPLIRALENENGNVRSKSAWALGEIGDERAILPLIEHLGDVNATTRWKAARSLGNFGKKALKPLIDALKYENAIVREKAALALGEIGDPDALDVLKIAMQDDDIYVRKSAEESIREIIRKIS